jgi:hypothetical protein
MFNKFLYYRVNKKFANDYSHCCSVHIVCPINIKPIPLDFSGHVLSSNAIESVKNYLNIVFIAYNKKIVINEVKIFNFA